MGIPIVKVAKGGLAVTESANKLGMPVTVAANGKGLAVTVVAKGGLPVVGAGGGPVPIQDPQRLVAMRSQALSNPIALTGGRNIVLTRIQLLTGAQDWASWKFKFASWFHTNAAVTSNKEQAGPQGFTIVAAALEKNTLSTPTQVVAPITFNGGSRSVVLADGDSEVISDSFLPSSWPSSQTLQGGRTYFVRCAIDVGANGQAVRFLNLATSLTAGSREQGVLGTSSDTAAITALVDTTADITAAAFADGSAVNYGYGPILAVGLTTGTLAKDLGVITQGSSFVEGAGDSAYTGSATSGGFVLRGLQSIGTPARKVPTANYAKGSGMWAEIATSNTRRERAWKHAKRLILDGPTNDVDSSISVASILTSWDTIRARAAIYGLPIVVGLVCPRTTGTYADDAGQTATANFGIGQNRDLINAALIARWQAGEIEYLLDPNLGRIGLPDHSTWQDIDAGGGLVRLQSATAADKWVASMTSDGVHPNTNGHARYAQLVDWVWEALAA